MSSRALRKLYGKDEITLPDVLHKMNDNTGMCKTEEKFDNADSASHSDEEPITNKCGRSKSNLFTLLDVDNEDDLLPSDNEEVSSAAKNAKLVKKDKKRKKKKNKKQEANSAKEDSSLELFCDNASPVSPSENKSFADSSAKQSKPLLQVDCRNLNPQNEMRRIFGSRVVQSEERTVRRRRHGTKLVSKQNHLVMPRDNWPPVNKLGLSMELLQSDEKCRQFTFVHAKQYQHVQIQFWDAVETLNPQSIVDIVQENPFHVDSLLQLSEVFKLSEDLQMAAELVERAIYSMEAAFHPLFNVASGNCRLDYRRPENRGLFLAIFRHLNFVGQRGCYLTALEFCKLLLSFDPDNDPLCVLLMIDFYALKSEQYDFLINLYHQWESHRNMSQLPNFAFSVPLAMFHRTIRDGEDTSVADNMLQNSLLMFPGFLMPMLDKCSIQPDSNVAQHEFFNSQAQNRVPATLQMLLALYVGRCSPCWKEVEVIRWLEKNVQLVLNAVNAKDVRVDDYQEKRLNRYRGTPKNIYRHLLISEIKEAVSSLPPEIANIPVLSYDPLPPDDSVISYSRPERHRRRDQDQNLLHLFVRSILPTYNPNEPAAVEVGENQGAVGGDGQTAGLYNSMRQLMEAMRNLLSNIQPTPAPIEGQNNSDTDDWDEDEDDNVRDFGLD